MQIESKSLASLLIRSITVATIADRVASQASINAKQILFASELVALIQLIANLGPDRLKARSTDCFRRSDEAANKRTVD